MSWLSTLARTYDLNIGRQLDGEVTLTPLYHTTQNAHIVVTVDDKGNFLRARVITDKNEQNTIIPCTEASAGRTGSKIAPHGLFDKLMYVAGDYQTYVGEDERCGFAQYIEQLKDWCASQYAHPKVAPIYNYLVKETLMADLLNNAKLMPVDEAGKVYRDKPKDPDMWPIFKIVASSPTDSLVLFECEQSGDPYIKLWEDVSIQTSWQNFVLSMDVIHEKTTPICYVTGELGVMAKNHPKRIRSGADGAKLISSHDSSYFTYRGRFIESEEACGVSVPVTLKAHSALSWLIKKQGLFVDTSAIIAWGVADDTVAVSPLEDTYDVCKEKDIDNWDALSVIGTAEGTAQALNKKIMGYKSNVNAEQMAIMMINESSPGTMSIKYYRELKNSDFLKRIEDWHTHCAWSQFFGKERRFYGAPSPMAVAQVAYGTKCDAKLKRLVTERMLPCILDGSPIPRDLLIACVHKTSNPNALDPWEFSRNLGVTCALYRYSHTERNYAMALEEDRKTRDYLYGQLLAVADYLEKSALGITNETTRETNAMKLMQRFMDRPFSTWRTLAMKLAPSRTRLQASRPGLLVKLEKILGHIHCSFVPDDYVLDKPLTGEALLSFYCQRDLFYKKAEEKSDESTLATESE